MDTKIKELVNSLTDAQRAMLVDELRASAVAVSRTNLEDITAERLRDPALAAQVRADIVAALRGEF